jgi:hypothetical protein
MVTKIRFVPDAAGGRLPDVVLGDLSFFNISQAGWLKVELRNPDNPLYIETRHYPPEMIESITEVSL